MLKTAKIINEDYLKVALGMVVYNVARFDVSEIMDEIIRYTKTFERPQFSIRFNTKSINFGTESLLTLEYYNVSDDIYLLKYPIKNENMEDIENFIDTYGQCLMVDEISNIFDGSNVDEQNYECPHHDYQSNDFNEY